MVSSTETMTIEAVELPAAFTVRWAMELGRRLNESTRQRVPLKQILTPETIEALLMAVTKILQKEPTLLEVSHLE